MKKIKLAVYNVFKMNVVKRAKGIALAREKAEEELASKKERLRNSLYECEPYFQTYLERWNESPEFQEILKEAYPSDHILREFLCDLQNGCVKDIAYYKKKHRAQYQLYWAVERNDEAAFKEALQNGADLKAVFAFRNSYDMGGDFYYYTIIDNIEGVIRRDLSSGQAETDRLLARYRAFVEKFS